jgi:hypothetical protein
VFFGDIHDDGTHDDGSPDDDAPAPDDGSPDDGTPGDDDDNQEMRVTPPPEDPNYTDAEIYRMKKAQLRGIMNKLSISWNDSERERRLRKRLSDFMGVRRELQLQEELSRVREPRSGEAWAFHCPPVGDNFRLTVAKYPELRDAYELLHPDSDGPSFDSYYTVCFQI